MQVLIGEMGRDQGTKHRETRAQEPEDEPGEREENRPGDGAHGQPAQ
jgi:hypothetical protein